MTRVLLLLALMCENVNAAPQVAGAARPSANAEADNGDRPVWSESSLQRAQGTNPAGAAPFTLLHPLCQTGFTIAMRFDERNSSGAIIKSVWVRKCVRVPRIVYGRKV